MIIDEYIFRKILLYIRHPIAELLMNDCKMYHNNILKNKITFLQYIKNIYDKEVSCPYDCTCRTAFFMTSF